MGYMIEDSLVKTLQSDDNGIHIEIRPKKYYTDDSGAHTVTLPEGAIILILYDGFPPYISV